MLQQCKTGWIKKKGIVELLWPASPKVFSNLRMPKNQLTDCYRDPRSASREADLVVILMWVVHRTSWETLPWHHSWLDVRLKGEGSSVHSVHQHHFKWYHGIWISTNCQQFRHAWKIILCTCVLWLKGLVSVPIIKISCGALDSVAPRNVVIPGKNLGPRPLNHVYTK